MRSQIFLLAEVAILLVAVAPLCLVSADDTSQTGVGVELKGYVFDANDIPVSGATVIIWTANVKQGYSAYCPSCYVDCGKLATTDSKGAFALRDVSRDLKFRLLVVKKDFAPAFVSNVDPLEGEMIAKIQPRHAPTDPLQVVRGRVVDSTGSPIADAVIEPEMVRFKTANGEISGRGGAVQGLDPLAVSNKAGEFEVVYASPAVDMTLMIKARGMAPARFEEVHAGSEPHDLTLNSGVTVHGRLIRKGQPVPNAEIGIVSQSRSVLQSFAEERIGTKRDGTFSFSNIPAGNKWFVYAKMASTVALGTTDITELTTVHDGDTVDLGDISIVTGYRLKGQIILSDGSPIPHGMRITVISDRAWDSLSVDLPSDGRFSFSNLRAGSYTISPAVKGYRLSKWNPNLSWTIRGLLDGNIDNLIINLDPRTEEFRASAVGNFIIGH